MEDGKVIIKREAAETDVNVLVSGVLRRKEKTFVRVSFVRGKDWAEGIVPDGMIEKSEGFTREELRQFEEYLAANKDAIIGQAKAVNPIRSLLGM